MFFVFHFLVFAYFTRSEINCFTQGTIRAKNYVKEHEEISNLKGVAQFKEVIYNTNKPNVDLESNVFEKILTNEMLSVEHNHILKDSSETPFSISAKHHLVTPTLELKQKWPKFKYINTAEEIETKDQKKNAVNKAKLIQKIISKEDDYLEFLPNSETKLKMKPFEINKKKVDKMPGIKYRKPSVINKVVDMRNLTPSEGKNNCTCKSNSTGPCNSCRSSSHNKKRCTHPTPLQTHACSRNGVTNHSCTQSQQYPNQPFTNLQFQDPQLPSQQFLKPAFAPFPYSFYPFYLPYSYSKTHRPPTRKHKCPNRKITDRPVDVYAYYDDNDSRERIYYDNEYYSDSKKPKGIPNDINEDALIKEIMNDMKIQKNKELGKKCYCDSSLKTCRVNIFLIIITLLYFAI